MNAEMQGGPPQPKSWFNRNWKWLVPVGCLLPMLCCGTFGAVTYLGASKLIEGSPVFLAALTEANQNAEVKATLGTPLTTGFGMSGEVKEGAGGGSANFTIPVKGPKGEGKLRVVATSKKGKWAYEVMEVEAGGKTIDLLGSKTDAPDDELPPPDEAAEEPADPDGD